MSVGSQVGEAMRRLTEQRFEDAVIAASVALSATARQEHPTLSDPAACRRFLDDNLPIVCKIGWVAFGVSQPIDFRYRRLDARAEGIDVRTMPEMLYDVVRCTAVHEARLPSNLRFTAAPVTQTGMDGELVLPIDVIYGLLLAIIGAPTNAAQRFDNNPTFSFGGQHIAINELWGKREWVLLFAGAAA